MNTQLAQGDSGAVEGQTAVEGPTNERSLVRREPIPRELAALGLVLGADADSGMTRLIVPPELTEKANVLTPVQMFQQVDANWRPSVRVVQLDPSADGAHFYKQQGKLAPRKQALELLADAAGVVQVRTAILGRERVEVGSVMAETFTHVAVLKIRKSDGTLRTLEASRTYEPFAEYEEVRDATARAKPYGQEKTYLALGPEVYEAEVRKRWLNEIKFAKAKNESKAVNRAMRSALQIPHTYTAKDAAKPFVVVGWNLAPQDTAAVQAAIAQLYGAAPDALELGPPPSHLVELPEVTEGEVVEDDATEASDQQAATGPTPEDPPPAPVAVPGSEDSPAARSTDGDSAREPASDLKAGPATPSPDAEQGEKAPEASTAPPPAPPLSEPHIPAFDSDTESGELTAEEREQLPAALKFKPPMGSYQTRTLAAVFELGDEADEWLAYALRQPWPQDQAFAAALRLGVKAMRPEMYAAWRAEA